jgi:hypothetical protein
VGGFEGNEGTSNVSEEARDKRPTFSRRFLIHEEGEACKKCTGDFYTLLRKYGTVRYGTIRNDRLTMDSGFMYSTVLRKYIFTVPYLLFVYGIGTVLPLLWPLPCTVQYVIFAL